MSKKSFKDNTANIDRFFSKAIQSKSEAEETQKTYYRINLKLRPGFKDHLSNESWKEHKSITEYLNDLIQADIDTKNTCDTQQNESRVDA